MAIRKATQTTMARLRCCLRMAVSLTHEVSSEDGRS
jgi:hypothetical protein